MGLWQRLRLALTGESVTKGEQTKRQDTSLNIGVGLGAGAWLSNPLPVAYSTYRTMRKDPTIALARALSIAVIVAGEWMVESDDEVDDERVKYIQDQLVPIRELIVGTALEGGCDFGWQPFEKVFDIKDGNVVLTKLKPLFHDITRILIDEVTGAFAGFRQGQFDLPLENSLLISFRVEGTQWHGQSLLENIRGAYNRWIAADAGAANYDQKVAGCQPHVEYPPGNTPEDEVETANYTHAKALCDGLEAGKGIVTPKSLVPGPDGAPQKQWEISLLEDKGSRQPGFRDRLAYLDALKARGLLWPERAILEGMFGTKAEAGEHAELAVTNADLTHRHITRHVNWHVIDQLLALNFGEDARGTIRLVAAPLADAQKAFIRTMFAEVAKTPHGYGDTFGGLDIDALLDMLGLPKSEEVVGDDDDVPALEAKPGPAEPGVEADDKDAATARKVYRENER